MAAATAWYRDSTIAVTNGSKAVTGTGTSWLSQILPADLLFTTDANGNLTAGPYEVETVTSDTAMTLKAVFPGTTASAAKYCVIRHFNNTLPADLSSRLSKLIANYQVTVDQFITFLTSSGTVTLTGLDGTTYSVQGLLGFANQVPDHNASTTAHGMTPVGRSLLQATDAASARSTMGVSGHQRIYVDGSDAVNSYATLSGGSAGSITLGQYSNGAWLGNSGTGGAAPFRFGVASGEAGRITADRRWLFGPTTDDGVSVAQFGGAGRFAGPLSVVAPNTGGGKPAALFDQGYSTTGDTVSALKINLNSSAGGAYIHGYNNDTAHSHNCEYLAATGWVARHASASRLQQQGGTLSYFADSGLTIGNVFTPTERFRISGSGYVGVANAAPSTFLDVGAANGNSYGAFIASALGVGKCGKAAFAVTQSYGNGAFFGTNNYYDGVDRAGEAGYAPQIMVGKDDGVIRFRTTGLLAADQAFGWTERMRITNAGRILIGTTTDDGVSALQVNGYIQGKGNINCNGTVSGTGAGQGLGIQMTDSANGKFALMQLCNDGKVRLFINTGSGWNAVQTWG